MTKNKTSSNNSNLSLNEKIKKFGIKDDHIKSIILDNNLTNDEKIKLLKKEKRKLEIKNKKFEVKKLSIEKERETIFIDGLDKLNIKLEKVSDENDNLIRSIKFDSIKTKIALISFNGAILALIISYSKTINFNFYIYILLFASFVFGFIQIIIFYFNNEFKYLKEKIFNECFNKVITFCRIKPNEKNMDDFLSYCNTEIITDKNEYNNISEIVSTHNKNNNVKKLFIKTLLFELLFYIPFVSGFILIVIKILSYIYNLS